MNENQTTPVPNGIPSVASKKSSGGKQKSLFLFGALVILAIGALTSFFVLSRKNSTEAPTEKTESVTKITSSQTLTLPPLETLFPKEPPKPQKEELAEIEPIVPTVIHEPQTPPEPTLAQRRFEAPMMGDRKTIESETENKGLAQTLEEEGYLRRESGGKLGSMLSSTNTPAVRASYMGDRSLLLPKGAFINCVLETKLDTTVPGMTSCVVPRNIYSANGKVLLIERGSKVIGEYKGAVENGLNRIFVLWTQIQTPKGVRVSLDSPGTDSLGGSGLSGEVDYHWWARFGNALLFSLIQDGFDYAISKTNDGAGGVNYYQSTEDGMNEIIQEAMRQSGNIPPTLTKNQGERIGIFVARDVDFSSVYTLKPI